MSDRTRDILPDRRPSAPPGLKDHVSRREAARLLGFASDFKVRQLERAGRLSPVRGAMGQAWYPRPQVLALAALGVQTGASSGGVTGPGVSLRQSQSDPLRRWTDAALINYLRSVSATPEGSMPEGLMPEGSMPGPTVVDLVADTGISIARAQRIYRFWLLRDAHPTAARLRTARGIGATASVVNPPPAPPAGQASPEPDSERRATARLQRDGLIAQLRDANPAVREEAFRQLRNLRNGKAR